MSDVTPMVAQAAEQGAAMHEHRQLQQPRKSDALAGSSAAACRPRQGLILAEMGALPAPPSEQAAQHVTNQMQDTSVLMHTRFCYTTHSQTAAKDSVPIEAHRHVAHTQIGPAAYSRLSIAGDTVADAHRQTDQGVVPSAAVAGAAAQMWPEHHGDVSPAAGGPWVAAAAQDVDAAKLRAQADQHTMQGQLSVEPELPPNLKRVRTSAVDMLKQSGAPGEDLSTFIPTPTWGSPRVADLQPAAVGNGKPSSSKKPGGTGLAARAAAAASLLAQAAANSAARNGGHAPVPGAAAAAAAGQEASLQPEQVPPAAAMAGVNSPCAISRAGSHGPETAAGEVVAAADAGAQDAGPSSHRLARRSSGHLPTLLQRQRSNDELATQYRLELQQLKAEHAALQMLTQHTEQETRPPVIAHEPTLPTPGVPRSLEAEAERLAARMLVQSGGDWQASMTSMMDMLRSNMQQGSQLLRGCSKAPQAGIAAAAAAAAAPTAAGQGLRAPHNASGTSAAGAAGPGPYAESGLLQEGMSTEAPAQVDANMSEAQPQLQQQQDRQHQQSHADADGGAALQRPRRCQRWFPEHEDCASLSSCQLAPQGAAVVAAAAAAALASTAPRGDPSMWGEVHPRAHGAVNCVSALPVCVGAGLYSEHVPGAGSMPGSPMHSAAGDNGYNSPAVSTAAGPSPFTAAACAGGSAAPAMAAAGSSMRTRSLTRRQSRLAPKPHMAAAPADAAGLVADAAEAVAFESAVTDRAAAVAAADSTGIEPESQGTGAAAGLDDSRGRCSQRGVVRSRARKSPPATTPKPGAAAAASGEPGSGLQPLIRGGICETAAAADADADAMAAMATLTAAAATGADADAGTGTYVAQEPQVVGQSRGHLPGQMMHTCSAAEAAAAFAAGATWAPHWEAPQQAASGAAVQRGGHRGLTVDTDCAGFDDASWICAGLLDTPGPAEASAAAGARQDAAAAAAVAQDTSAAAAGAKVVGPAAGGAAGQDRQQPQQQLFDQQYMQLQMHYQLPEAAQHVHTQAQVMPGVAAAGGGYWHPGGSTAMDTGHVQATPNAGVEAAVTSMAFGSTSSGFPAAVWQQAPSGSVSAGMGAAGTAPVKVQAPDDGSEAALAALMAASHMYETQHMPPQQHQHQHQHQQHAAMYQQQASMQQASMQQQQQHMASRESHSMPGAGSSAPVPAGGAPVVADQALLNMLLGWTSDS